MPKRKYTLNGVTRDQRSGAEYVIKQTVRKRYLHDMHERLQRDVGFMLECLEERNKQEPQVGFFAMVRAVMPIVETLAISEGRYPSDVLADLGFGAPHLMWDLYRNVFLHGDEFVIAAVGDSSVQSGIVLSRASDDEIAKRVVKDGLMFDAAYTYRRLLKYLDFKIGETTDDAMVDVIEMVRYDPDSKNARVRQTVDEIRTIHEATHEPVGESESS